MIPAALPIQRPRDARLLHVDAHGCLSHHPRMGLPMLVRAGDVVVANDAATLPASLAGSHVPTGATIEVRLAGRDSLLPHRVQHFVAVVFGAGNYRTPTEARPLPPPLHTGDALLLGPLRGTVMRTLDHPRLIELRFKHRAAEIWEGLARHGRPIQYAYVPDPLAIWDTWTPIASLPVAFEAPSASFALDWRSLQAVRLRGASFVTITLAAGISSTGDADLDRRLPFPEPYAITRATARVINDARRHGGRVVAVGTTVVRALEHAARPDGTVRAGRGIATRRIGPDTPLKAVDAIVSGMHEPGTSHFELLRAFHADGALAAMDREAEAHGYRNHEFGDSVFLERRAVGTTPGGSSCHSRVAVH